MKKTALTMLVTVVGIAGFAESAGLKKLKSLTCAKVLAQRNIVETVYGVKLRFIEEVIDLKDGNFLGTTETKTGKRAIKGITFAEKYDPKTNIAQVTATLRLRDIKDIIDTKRFNLDKYPDKEIKRVAFASSTPAMATKIAALRAAELDAYKNLYKRIGGFTLESNSKVENFVLTSDKVKASVVGALLGAEIVGFAWDGKGKDAIAIVKVRLNLKELSEMLGQKIIDHKQPYVYAEGRAAQKNDKTPKLANNKRSSGKSLRVSSKVVEGSIDIVP